jgi:hypothetical protein
MIALADIRSLTDFQRNTKSHLKRLKATGRPEVLTVNGKAELIVQNAAAYEETLTAFRAQSKTSQMSRTKTHQAWVDEAMTGSFRPGSTARLRQIAAKARAVAA